MLTFKEYVENKEEIDESIVGAAKFAGGFGGNLLGQSAKGLWNLGKGVTKVGLGSLGAATDVVKGAAQASLGDTERSSRSLNSAKTRISTVGSGLVDAGKGVTQLAGAATGVTPFLRGIQASSEEGISPLSKERNSVQKLLGLNANQVPQEKEKKIKRSQIIRPKIEDIFVLSPVTTSINVAHYISEAYKASQEGKKVITYDAKEFVSNLLISYSNHKNKNPRIDKKLNYILKRYFPNYKIIKIKSFESIGIQMNPDSILKIKNFINSIIVLEVENPEKVTYLPEDSVRFRKDLIEIHNNVLNTKNFNKNIQGEIKDLKKQVIRILNHYYPEKEIKTEIRKESN